MPAQTEPGPLGHARPEGDGLGQRN